MEQMIIQKIDLLSMWVIGKWWYCIPVGVGMIFRLALTKQLIKLLLRDILIITVLMFWWNKVYNNLFDNTSIAAVMGGTLMFAFYILVKKCEPNGGYTESILDIISCIMLTLLSFQPPLGTILGAITIVVAASAVYKCFGGEFSDVIEIIVVSVESIVISIIMSSLKVETFTSILLYVLFIETAIFMVNKVIKFSVERCCDEDADGII